MLDNDGDGSISMSDLREVTKHLDVDICHEELEEMFAEADKDGDGQVSFEGQSMSSFFLALCERSSYSNIVSHTLCNYTW